MRLFSNDSIFTVVSRPGPVERRILDGLLPEIEVHRRVGAGVSLRTLEGGTGPTVVFLHGRGHAASIWAPILRAFVNAWRVVAIDLPGFGHSGAPPCDASTPEEGLSYFVTPVEDFLASLPGVADGLLVVGHSLGGLVALSIALGNRVPIRGLVLIGAMGLGPTMSVTSRVYLRSSPERIARFRARLMTSASARTELDALRVELLTARGGRPDASRAFDAMVPLVGPVFHVRDRLVEIAAPTLLLWGEHDEAFPLPLAIDARARLPHAELTVLRAPHSPHVSDPEAVISRIEPWLSELR